MENNINTYTVSIYTENNIGLLNRISAIFQRRRINIESLNISVSEIDQDKGDFDISKFNLPSIFDLLSKLI